MRYHNRSDWDAFDNVFPTFPVILTSVEYTTGIPRVIGEEYLKQLKFVRESTVAEEFKTRVILPDIALWYGSDEFKGG
jgi:hypothetical protein